MRHSLRAGILALTCAAAAAGCATNTSPGNIIDQTKATLTVAVGTLNDSFGTISALNGGPGSGTYLNLVTAFRNQLGNSAFISPGTAQLTGNGLALTLGSLYSYGQAPGTNGLAGQPPAYTPANSTGTGYATGFIFTGAPPAPGTYTVTVTLKANGQTRQYAASATLPATPVVLGADQGGSYLPDSPDDGGGTFTFATPPAGVTESIAFFLSGTTSVATVAVKTGTNSAVLPPGTLVPGSSYTVIVVGADYPFVEAGPPQSTQPVPQLTGSSGTSDLTASNVISITG
jgi:hypothetical protein